MQTFWSQIDQIQQSFGCFGPLSKQNQELRIPFARFHNIWRAEHRKSCLSDTILHVKKQQNHCVDHYSVFSSAVPGPLGTLDQSWELNLNTFLAPTKNVSKLLLCHCSSSQNGKVLKRQIKVPIKVPGKFLL